MMLSDVCLSDVCRVHRKFSWHPQLLEARRAGCSRPGVYGLELSRSVRRACYRGGAYRGCLPPTAGVLYYFDKTQLHTLNACSSDVSIVKPVLVSFSLLIYAASFSFYKF